LSKIGEREGDFLNAEGAKVTQRVQKGEKRKPKGDEEKSKMQFKK
jgi:hypothetical protein